MVADRPHLSHHQDDELPQASSDVMDMEELFPDSNTHLADTTFASADSMSLRTTLSRSGSSATGELSQVSASECRSFDLDVSLYGTVNLYSGSLVPENISWQMAASLQDTTPQLWKHRRLNSIQLSAKEGLNPHGDWPRLQDYANA